MGRIAVALLIAFNILPDVAWFSSSAATMVGGTTPAVLSTRSMSFSRSVSEAAFARRGLQAPGLAIPAALLGEGFVYRNFNISTAYWTGNSLRNNTVFPETSNTPYGIPEISKRPSVGLALCGGGFRAATNSHGVVTVLQALGLLKSIRWMSSNSGSTWYATALSYANVPMDKLFGLYIPPENITMDVLRSNQSTGFLGRFFGNKDLMAPYLEYSTFAFASLLFTNGKIYPSLLPSWAQTISRVLFSQIGMDLHNSTVSMAGTRGNIANKTRSLFEGKAKVFVARETNPEVPFLIAVTNALELPNIFYEQEATPLYFGTMASYPNLNRFDLGGGFFQPFALNSQPITKSALRKSPVGGQQTEVHVDSLVPAIAYSVSSSFFPGELLTKLLIGGGGDLTSKEALVHLYGGNVWNIWSPSHYPPGGATGFVDGGGSDNLALYPQLRRRAKSVIVTYWGTTTNQTDLEVDGERGKDGYGDLAQYFGMYTGPGPNMDAVPLEIINARQVFPKSGWYAMWADLDAKKAAGKPLTHRAKYTVIESVAMGVPGGWDVEVLWIVLSPIPEWMDKLPAETRDWIEYQMANPVAPVPPHLGPPSWASWPFVPVLADTYPTELVNANALMSAYATMSVKQDIEELIANAV